MATRAAQLLPPLTFLVGGMATRKLLHDHGTYSPAGHPQRGGSRLRLFHTAFCNGDLPRTIPIRLRPNRYSENQKLDGTQHDQHRQTERDIRPATTTHPTEGRTATKGHAQAQDDRRGRIETKSDQTGPSVENPRRPAPTWYNQPGGTMRYQCSYANILPYTLDHQYTRTPTTPSSEIEPGQIRHWRGPTNSRSPTFDLPLIN